MDGHSYNSYCSHGFIQELEEEGSDPIRVTAVLVRVLRNYAVPTHLPTGLVPWLLVGSSTFIHNHITAKARKKRPIKIKSLFESLAIVESHNTLSNSKISLF